MPGEDVGNAFSVFSKNICNFFLENVATTAMISSWNEASVDMFNIQNVATVAMISTLQLQFSYLSFHK